MSNSFCVDLLLFARCSTQYKLVGICHQVIFFDNRILQMLKPLSLGN